VVALDNVDFEVPEGITGLLGSNGAGKSTAIKLFFGLTDPTAGNALVLGKSALSNPGVRERLGYMPEHDCLPGNVSAADFLTHMAQVSGLPPSHARGRAADTLRHVGLFEERYRHIGGYSTGMKQRVKLAQALVHDPVLVLLDEPTAGLDPGGRTEMLDLVRKTYRDFGINVMLSSHLMGDVERVCDQIVVLELGKVAHQGAVTSFTEETLTVHVEVDSNRPEFIEALRAAGITPEFDGPSVVVQDATPEMLDIIRDAVVASGARLRRMGPKRHALQELFSSPVESLG